MDDPRIAEYPEAAALPPRHATAAPARAAAAPSTGQGRMSFAKAIERDAECGSLRLSGMIVVELEGVGPSLRGRIADALDDGIERELAARGAAGPGLLSASDRDAALSDQLFRARRVGAPGIAVVLGPLRAAAGPLGALEPEDCATLRFLATASRERPVVLILDERDARTGGYADPVPLGQLLAVEPTWRSEPEPTPPAFTRDLGPTRTPAHESPHAHAPPPAHAHAPESAHAPAPALSPALDLDPALSLARHTAGATIVDREESWRAWTLQLVAARG